LVEAGLRSGWDLPGTETRSREDATERVAEERSVAIDGDVRDDDEDRDDGDPDDPEPPGRPGP